MRPPGPRGSVPSRPRSHSRRSAPGWRLPRRPPPTQRPRRFARATRKIRDEPTRAPRVTPSDRSSASNRSCSRTRPGRGIAPTRTNTLAAQRRRPAIRLSGRSPSRPPLATAPPCHGIAEDGLVLHAAGAREQSRQRDRRQRGKCCSPSGYGSPAPARRKCRDGRQPAIAPERGRRLQPPGVGEVGAS